MGYWKDLKDNIAAVIHNNGAREISGDILKLTLNNITDIVGGNFQFVSIATPGLNPGTPQAKVYYQAFQKALYPNFGGLTVTGDIAFFLWNGIAWDMKQVFLTTGGGGGGGTGVNQQIIQLPGITTNTDVILPPDTWIQQISFIDIEGSSVVSIGTTSGGMEISDTDFTVSGFTPIIVQKKYEAGTTIYINISGGKVNCRIDLFPYFFSDTSSPVSPIISYSKLEMNDLLDLKADKSDVLLLSGTSQSVIPASIQFVNDSINYYNDHNDVLHLSGSTPSEIPASMADIEATGINLKADKTDVLRLSATEDDLHPASIADIGLKLLWFGTISGTGGVNKIKGSLTVTCVRSSIGVYAISHNYGGLGYTVLPGLGNETSQKFASPRSFTNKLENSFIIGCSDDGSGNDIAFQILIYKY